MKTIQLKEINHSEVTGKIAEFIREKSEGMSGGVVGLSGGVDSTVVACIAKEAYSNVTGNEVVGYILPVGMQGIEDALAVVKLLGIRHEVIDIGPLVEAYFALQPKAVYSTHERGNVISRIRAVVLNSKAAAEGKLVLGTGNYDEDVCIGYYTLFGDGAVHVSPIGGLHKRFVREIAVKYGFGVIAKKEPDAGLEEGMTDFKNLGYSYDMIELVSEAANQGFSFDEVRDSEQVIAQAHKDMDLYKKVYGESKFKEVLDMLEDISRRHQIAKLKSSVVSPPVPEIPFK